MHPSSPSADYISVCISTALLRQSRFLLLTFPEDWGARLRISGGCPARGEPEALIDLCSSIACRAQPCQRCSPVLQALIFLSMHLYGSASAEPFFLFLTTLSVTCGDRFPFLSLRDIFPRRGGSRPSRGRLWAMPQSFPLPLKPSPWGRWHRAAMTEGVTFLVKKGYRKVRRLSCTPKFKYSFRCLCAERKRSAFQIVPPCGSVYFSFRSFSR